MSNNKARKTHGSRGGWLVGDGIFKFEERDKANEEPWEEITAYNWCSRMLKGRRDGISGESLCRPPIDKVMEDLF